MFYIFLNIGNWREVDVIPDTTVQIAPLSLGYTMTQIGVKEVIAFKCGTANYDWSLEKSEKWHNYSC